MKIELFVEKTNHELDFLESIELPYMPQIGATFLSNKGVFVVTQVVFNQDFSVLILDNVNDARGYLNKFV